MAKNNSSDSSGSTPSVLSYLTLTQFQISQINLWFADPSYDLETWGTTDEEKRYLRAIAEVAVKSGVTNIRSAHYILELEMRLKRIENTLEIVRSTVLGIIGLRWTTVTKEDNSTGDTSDLENNYHRG